jgi:ATP-binding cassette subfamily B protein
MTDGRLLRFAKKARKYIFLNVLARWVGLLLAAFIVLTAARLIAEIPVLSIGGGPSPLPAIGACACAALLRALCEFFASKAAFKASAGVKRQLRERLYDKLLALGGAAEGASGAEAVQVAVEGIDQIENYFGKYLPQLFYSVIAPLTLFVLIAPLSLSAALILLVCTPLIPLLLLLIMRMAKRMMRKQLKSYTSLGDFFLESLRGMTTLKIYGADERRHEEMNGHAEAFRKSTMRVLRMQLNSIVLMDLVAYGGAALGVILAARGFLAGDIGLSGAISILLLSAEFFIPFRQLGSYFHVAMSGLSACERVFRILDEKEPADGESGIPAGALAVEAEGLSYAYAPGRQALSNISFSAPAAGLTGIAGVSGCGKSTIARLISGGLARENYAGSVRIGGVELRDLKIAELRKRVCLVTHEDCVFTGTVSENLREAKPEGTTAEFERALQRVKLYDFFAGAEGLDTYIAEGGANLSGGQKQRLSLARALLRDCDVYVFDEATSNIDAESEEAVLSVIRALAKSKNVLMISHRLANLIPADAICAMEAGRVAERGTHEALTAAGGVYARLFREQQALERYAAGGVAQGEGSVDGEVRTESPANSETRGR